MRKMTDRTGAIERNSKFVDLRIKVNGRSYFSGCLFINCTFIGKGKEKATFESCMHQ